MSRPIGRVLLEAPGGEAPARRRALELAGYETRWCPGPDDCEGSTCGLVSEHHCALADWADVVVNDLGVQRHSTRRVLRALHDSDPTRSIVIEASPRAAEMWRPLLAGDRVLEAPATPQELVWAVSAALHRGEGETRHASAHSAISGFCSAPELE